MRFALNFFAFGAAMAISLPRHERALQTLQGRVTLTPPATLPGNYQYMGCYKDSGERRLDGARYDDAVNMTDESCVAFCSSGGFPLAGVEYAQECYCGYQFKSGAVKLDESVCNVPCTGNSAEPCGGGFAFTLYNNSAAPAVKAEANGFAYKGCYTDSADRVLANSVHTPETTAKMTVELCTSTCAQQGYSFAGVEYGGECFCDNKLGSAAQLKTDGTCNMPCNGDKTEFCGGPYRLNVYSKGSPTSATASTSSATPTPTATAAQQQLIDNGDFNAGGTWSWWYRNDDSRYLQVIQTDQPLFSHSAPGYGTIYATTPKTGAPAVRGACFLKTFAINASAPGTYQLEYYAGSFDRSGIIFTQRPEYSVTVSAEIAGTSVSDIACWDKCPINTYQGTYKRYQKYSYPYNLAGGQYTLRICADYAGSRNGSEDTFFLDDVSLTGPK